jgi:hypothetical protein
MTIGILTSEKKAEDYCLKEGLIESQCHIKKLSSLEPVSYIFKVHTFNFRVHIYLKILHPNL